MPHGLLGRTDTTEPITIRVPATSANLGPGFDALGLAVALFNEVTAEPADTTFFEIQGEGDGRLPRDERNLLYRAYLGYCRRSGSAPVPLRVRAENAIPLSRGLGSSAAAVVAGVVLGEELHGAGLTLDDLLGIAAEMEGHPDNAAAALLGGLTVAWKSGDRYGARAFQPHPDLSALLAIPEEPLATSAARSVLPDTVSRDDAVFNIGRAALLVASVLSGSTEHLAAAMQDRLHQEYRASLMPHFHRIVEVFEAAGVPACLSGAGPTVLGLVETARGQEAERMARKALSEAGLPVRILWCGLELRGAGPAED